MDLGDLVLRRDAGHSQGIAHSSTLPDRVRDSIEKAKLYWQVLVLLTHLDKEARLVRVTDNFVVNDLEIAGQLSGLIVPDKLVSERSHIEVNIVNAVRAFVTPVGDDRLARKLHSHNLLPLVVRVSLLLELHNTLETSFRRHKLENIVNSKSHSKFALECRRLEPRPHGKTNVAKVNG